MRQKIPGRKPEDNPAAWFAVLESARQQNDFARAAEAQKQLTRLGVRVIYGRQRERKAVRHDR